MPLSGPANNMGWKRASGLNTRSGALGRSKVEYDYVRLNSASVTAAGPGRPFTKTISANNRVINLVTVGLNYKFGGW